VQRHAPRVYYCVPDYDIPTGGIRVAYRHVDILNEAGIPAAVLHHRATFRCTWFENHTQIAGSRNVVVGPEDLIVVGELATGLLSQLPPGFRFVVFNQNPHLTWRRVSDVVVRSYAASPYLAAILTVSRHSSEMLRHAMPGNRIIRVHNSIDPKLFYCRSRPAERSIAFMPRRGSDEARQVLGILRARGTLDGWRVTALERLSERQVAARLRSTLVFLSFAYHEGFGLPAAEAMACGAYVVGFHGFGGQEFFLDDLSSPVDAGDILGFARKLEDVLATETQTPGWCARRGAAAARYVATEYSPEREREDVIAAYSSLIGGHASAPHWPERPMPSNRDPNIGTDSTASESTAPVPLATPASCALGEVPV
jgi:glycosyltransferase involved in cell wall biosynthesis